MTRAKLSIALALLAAAPALAQDQLLGSPLLVGSARTVGMGGASVGIAEGVDGMASNLAAIAHRSPLLDRDWDLGLGLSSISFPVGNPRRQDFDADGAPDSALRSSQLLAGVYLQIRSFGFGMYTRWTSSALCEHAACEAQSSYASFRTSLAFGYGFLEDQLIVSAGLHGVTASIAPAFDDTQRDFAGTGLDVGALFRPLDQPYRVGLTLRTRVQAEAVSPGPLVGVADQIISPMVISLGGSLRLGAGANGHNRRTQIDRAELMIDDEVIVPTGPLLSVQLDAVLPERDSRMFGAPVQDRRAGTFVQLTPRVGVEHELWPGRLRVRGGTYLEASPYEGVLPRPHLTGGAEVFLFRKWKDFAASFSFDLAPSYSNVGFSVGLWQ